MVEFVFQELMHVVGVHVPGNYACWRIHVLGESGDLGVDACGRFRVVGDAVALEVPLSEVGDEGRGRKRAAADVPGPPSCSSTSQDSSTMPSHFAQLACVTGDDVPANVGEGDIVDESPTRCLPHGDGSPNKHRA